MVYPEIRTIQTEFFGRNGQITSNFLNAPERFRSRNTSWEFSIDKANQILDGGSDAFDARLAQLGGTPVVVNKWASWCGPCRFEFPWFQSLAQKRGGQIAFLGVNSNDSSGSASTFLSELPLPYPSYSDPDLKIAQDLGGPPQAFPTTTFYDRSGKQVFTHPGVYANEADLVADVNRYAG